ncbi:MAG: Rha family transcriptional regulator [Clostridia bacterium]|jgi:Rha family phage regulatory protein|nr:Rha family transcriptional regulator [Clostridia bacterium]
MLVNITELNNKEEILTVNSRDVANDFEKEHKDVLEKIRNLTAEFSAAKSMFIENEYDNRGKKYPEYLLTRDGFSLLVMGFTGQKALEWKLKYIEAFNMMEKELKRVYEERKQWEIERAKGVLVRHILTDTIKMKVADSPHKRFMYPNYTRLIYKSIFGKSFNDLKKEYGIKAKESLRDYLTSEQVKEVEQMEMLVSSLIGVGMGYEEIKNFIAEKYKPNMLLAG